MRFTIRSEIASILTGITEAVVKVRWNQEPIKRLVHSLGSELQDEELQDEEDLVEEVEVPVTND